jgi:hypothetical protein
VVPDRALEGGFFSFRQSFLAPGAEWAITLDNGAVAQVFDAETGAPHKAISAGVVGFDRSGHYLAASTAQGIQVYSLPDLDPVGAEIRRPEGISWAEIDQNVDKLFAWVEGRTMAVFDIEGGHQLNESTPSPTRLAALAVSSQDNAIVGYDDGTIAIVDPDRRTRLATDEEAADRMPGGRVAISSDGGSVATWSAVSGIPARAVRITDAVSGRLVAEVKPDDPSGVRLAAVTADPWRLITLHDSGRVVSTPIDAGTSSVLGTVDISVTSDQELVASADGTVIAIVEMTRSQVIDAAGRVRSIPVGGVAGDLTPDGAALILGECGELRTLDLRTETVAIQQALDGCPGDIDVDQSGTHFIVNNIVSPQDRSVLELRSTKDLGFVGSAAVGQDQATDVTLVDSAAIPTALSTQSVYLPDDTEEIELRRWAVDRATWADRACALAGRNLTHAEWSRFVAGEPYRVTCPDYPAQPAETPSAAPSPTPSVESPPDLEGGLALCDRSFDICYLEPARYELDWFEPPLSFEAAEGWYVNGTPSGSLIAFIRDAGHFAEIARGVHEVFDDAGKKSSIDATPDSFLRWLRTRGALTVGDPVETSVAGQVATQVDVIALQDAVLFTYVDDDAQYEVSAGQQIRFILSSVDGSLIHVAVEAPVAEFDGFWSVARPLIESITFGRHSP